MNLDLLKRLLAVPTCSRQEDQVVAFLVDHVRQRGPSRCGKVTSDDWKNVCIRKGRAGTVPCVAAHIDSVHRPQEVEIVEQDGVLFGLDAMSHRAGIGADDKAGVFICLELLERFDDIAVVLFAAEEIGCVGSKHAPADWFEDVGYVIEFDCPGYGLVSYTSAGERLFANGGEFIQTALPVMQEHGLTLWQHHPYTDVMALRQRFEFSCLNLSAGYRDWHQHTEQAVVEEVEAALHAGEALIAALGGRRYPFPAGSQSTAEPAIEVTHLNVPTRLTP